MKTAKVILIVVVMLAGTSFLAKAQQGAKAMSPRAVVISLYKQHKKRSPFFQTKSRALLDKYFARELANLLWEDAHSSGDEVGALDGDPLFNAQDMRITNFFVHQGTIGAQVAEVPVSFKNLGEKHRIVFRLVPESAGWKIVNVEYDDGSSLLKILKGDNYVTKHRLTVEVYFVVVGDNGKTGKRIGCGDSLVPRTRFIELTAAPLRAALEGLLSTPREVDRIAKLENFWQGRSLKLESVSILNNTATIHISGEVFVAGVCDIPRIESQIEETAQQFPTVKKVKVFIGKRTLADAIR